VKHNTESAYVWDFGSFAFDRSINILDYYKNAEFVLAMRGHGQIVPIGLNVPVISLENHDKNIGLMRKLNLEYYNVNILEKELSVKIIEKVDHI